MTHQPRTAQRVLESLSIRDPQGIDLEAIAWLSGAKVKYRELDGCDACIAGRADVGRAIISIDNRALSRRQRFSLAHEIGHWEWHRGHQLLCSKDDIGGSGKSRGLSKEAAANRFAAELLMPRFMLKDAMRDFNRLDMRTVRKMATHFDVSLTAMAYRLVESDFHPSLLIAYGKEGRRWFVRSKSIDEKWFPKDTLDRQSGAYSILFEGAGDDGYMSTVEADTWFDVQWADQVDVGEQSFRTQDDEVVTLLVARSDRMLAD
ncbi:ImmA/IrrE family metallo-endopeptidase [Tropicimonas sp. TH_r6]|uniref:ImmA/IrrE family metallo-endopeptidase n=1 Tax=Tropicimonas sp. TH_r6 TaxID=3082085 RepID=UPI00295421A4|nr:ImmA/IrrE family metallo-endopeptidase [Tropicimonas sp. TH_r6]MDV7142991.1 ImmA/IrrE family metallo-endopeptidase [Tropicimonas sp. TH_r6]